MESAYLTIRFKGLGVLPDLYYGTRAVTMSGTQIYRPFIDPDFNMTCRMTKVSGGGIDFAFDNIKVVDEDKVLEAYFPLGYCWADVWIFNAGPIPIYLNQQLLFMQDYSNSMLTISGASSKVTGYTVSGMITKSIDQFAQECATAFGLSYSNQWTTDGSAYLLDFDADELDTQDRYDVLCYATASTGHYFIILGGTLFLVQLDNWQMSATMTRTVDEVISSKRYFKQSVGVVNGTKTATGGGTTSYSYNVPGALFKNNKVDLSPVCSVDSQVLNRFADFARINNGTHHLVSIPLSSFPGFIYYIDTNLPGWTTVKSTRYVFNFAQSTVVISEG